MIEVDKYVENQLMDDKKVIIEIDKVVVNGYMQMNWLIDNKYLLEDFPSEVFEGEKAEEFAEQNKVEEKGK